MKPLTFGALQGLGPSGMTSGAWRHPDTESTRFMDLRYWAELAQQLEAAGVDFLFMADTYGYPLLHGELASRAVEDALGFPMGDPLVMLSAVAAATKDLGLVLTLSTMTESPAHLARRVATLDTMTGGRVGWNIVTGQNQASTVRIFGTGLVPHDERYDRAADFVDLALKLFEGSWAPDALVEDRDGGVYADPRKVGEIVHDGPYFSSRGMLPVPPSPQRSPLLFQAGASPAGRRLAAKYAEGVFLPGGNPATVVNNIAATRKLAQAEFGRDPESIVFLVGALFIAAETEEDAIRKREEVLALSTMESAVLDFSQHTGIDLTGADPTQPIPADRQADSLSSVQRQVHEDGTPFTVGEILDQVRLNGINALTFVGTGAQIAEQVEAYVRTTGVDGFLIEPFNVPGTYADLFELVFPELRARGLLKSGYAGGTLREHVFGEGRALLHDTHSGAVYRR